MNKRSGEIFDIISRIPEEFHKMNLKIAINDNVTCINERGIMKAANKAKDKLKNTMNEYLINKKQNDEQKGEPKNYSDCQFAEEGQFFVECIQLMTQVFFYLR